MNLETMKLIQLVLLLSIPCCLVLTLWIKKQHYKKMCSIKDEHIRILEVGAASLMEHNKEMRDLLIETNKMLHSLNLKAQRKPDPEE